MPYDDADAPRLIDARASYSCHFFFPDYSFDATYADRLPDDFMLRQMRIICCRRCFAYN